VEMRNLTLNLPTDLVRQAKVYAAEHDTTINSFIRQVLQEALAHDCRTRAAAKRLLTLAEEGPYFSVDPSSIEREELHERR